MPGDMGDITNNNGERKQKRNVIIINTCVRRRNWWTYIGYRSMMLGDGVFKRTSW